MISDYDFECQSPHVSLDNIKRHILLCINVQRYHQFWLITRFWQHGTFSNLHTVFKNLERTNYRTFLKETCSNTSVLCRFVFIKCNIWHELWVHIYNNACYPLKIVLAIKLSMFKRFLKWFYKLFLDSFPETFSKHLPVFFKTFFDTNFQSQHIFITKAELKVLVILIVWN